MEHLAWCRALASTVCCLGSVRPHPPKEGLLACLGSCGLFAHPACAQAEGWTLFWTRRDDRQLVLWDILWICPQCRSLLGNQEQPVDLPLDGVENWG